MKKHLKYLHYLLRHKWYVALACFRHGLIWRGIIHDWSKFLPSEWFPYVEYFYGEKLTDEEIMERWRREQAVCMVRITKSNAEKDYDFDLAWLKHQHRSPHHWQHWILRNDSGLTVVMEMPHRDRLEMLCDWEGAGMAISGKNDTRGWYLKNRDRMQLAPRTRQRVELYLGID